MLSLGVSQSALGIFGDGSLLYARDLDWGYAARRRHNHCAASRIAGGSSVGRAPPLVPLSEAILGRGRVAGVALRRHARDPIAHRADDRAPQHRGRDARHARGYRRSALPDGFGERASTLRLASSIAVEPPPVNLLPDRRDRGPNEPIGTHDRDGRHCRRRGVRRFLYGQASVARTDAERRLDAARREVSSLRAVAAANDARAATAEIQGARLRSPGPVMARVLEAVTNAAPQAVALRSLRGSRDGSQWSVSVTRSRPSDETARRGRRSLPARAVGPWRAASASHHQIPAGNRRC